MPSYVAPPGWPAAVRPPGAPDWERTAGSWLLDICPPEYRSYPALRRHVVVLARFAVLHVEARQAAINRGLSEARGALRDVAWDDVTEYLPAVVIALATPFTFSIATGIGLGFVTFAAVKVVAGRAGEVGGAVWVIAAASVVKFWLA